MLLAARIARFSVSTAVFLLAASLLASLLFRAAPGSDVDTREINPAYSPASLEAMRQRKLEIRDRIGISASYFTGMLAGRPGALGTDGRAGDGAVAAAHPGNCAAGPVRRLDFAAVRASCWQAWRT